MKKKLETVLIKPAGPDCNMACSYCFYLEKDKLFPENMAHRMSGDILEEIIRQVLEQGERAVSFAWQGGEPTLMGLDFFKKAVELQMKYGRDQTVGNGLQTNGILIDEEWADFLREFQFLVGLSLDGPRHVHDRYRRLRSGDGSWEKVVSKAELLIKKGVEVNALTVLNDYSVRFPKEIYAFHKSLGLNFMQFIPCIEPDSVTPQKPAAFSVDPEGYGRFLCTVFDLWMNDFDKEYPTTSIRFFDSIFFAYVGRTPPQCNLLKKCGNYVVVEHNGDVFSCDFFVYPEWKLGNIKERKLCDMLNSSRQKKFGGKKADLPQECRKCRWLPLCRGGCTKDRLADPKEKSLNVLCPAYKMFFAHADKHMRLLAERWEKENDVSWY